MTSNAIDIKVTGVIGTIVLNRPQRRNALTRAMLAQLSEALSDLHLEKRVRAVVLTGAGSAFCAGMDVHEMQHVATLSEEAQRQNWGDTAEAYCELVTQMMQLPKPIIASVNGPAVAGGAGLVLAADVVVATPDRPIRADGATPRVDCWRRRTATRLSRRRRYRSEAACYLSTLRCR